MEVRRKLRFERARLFTKIFYQNVWGPNPRQPS